MTPSDMNLDKLSERMLNYSDMIVIAKSDMPLGLIQPVTPVTKPVTLDTPSNVVTHLIEPVTKIPANKPTHQLHEPSKVGLGAVIIG